MPRKKRKARRKAPKKKARRKPVKKKVAKKMKKKRCAAIVKTKSGRKRPCKNYAVGKSRYCAAHKK